jgi:hypothetical protein
VRETVGAAENVILGVLLDRAGDVVYPLTVAEHIADALRDAGLLPELPNQRRLAAGDQP